MYGDSSKGGLCMKRYDYYILNFCFFHSAHEQLTLHCLFQLTFTQTLAGNVLQAFICKHTADLGAAMRLLRQLLRTFQRHPCGECQYAGRHICDLSSQSGCILAVQSITAI